MKVLHLTESFLPASTGGKEVYAYNLARVLRDRGVDNHFMIHQKTGERLGDYQYDGFPVKVLPPIDGIHDRKSVYSREYFGIPGFREALRSLRPDVVHFHDFSGGASLTHLKESKNQGVKTVMTYHSPGQSCMQRSLRYANKEICDGRLDRRKCTQCLFLSNAINRPLASIFSLVPPGATIENNDSGIQRAMKATSASALFIGSFYEGMRAFDRIHVHAHWTRDLFLLNGISVEKLFFARTAGPVSIKKKDKLIPQKFSADRPLRIVFVGRCEFIKGVHVLVDAALRLPQDTPIQFSFFGPHWEKNYGVQLLQKMANDSRFLAPSLLEPDQMVERISREDAIVVPSIWPETGPLSMLEAFAAGLPVIGTDAGGISEWVEDQKNGFLFRCEDATELANIFLNLIANPHTLEEITQGVSLQRHMHDLGQEIKCLYDELLA